MRVYAGVDPVTGRRHDLVETIPAGPQAEGLAEAALTRLLNELDEQRNPRTNATVDQLLDRYLSMLQVGRTTEVAYRGYLAKHVRPFVGSLKVGAVDVDSLDSLYAELRRCRDHCDRRAPAAEHRCRPLANSTIRQIHFILSGAYKKAVRWRWVASNPVAHAEPPPPTAPDPRPPSTEDAARLLADAWRDPDWGTLVWLTMITGARRGEMCGLRWQQVDLPGGVLTVRSSIAQDGTELEEKDTKTHQQRRVALDAETVAVLTEHWDRWRARTAALGVELTRDAFVFSLAPDAAVPLVPSSVTQRYSRMAARLGIKTHLHSLRHYSATELIAAGVDVRTVAGRLGHGGGGITTLRVYAAWLSESDQRAAAGLLARVPARLAGSSTDAERAIASPRRPYEKIAAELREQILAGSLRIGDRLPPITPLASQHGVAVSTVGRAMSLLDELGLTGVAGGRRVVAAWPTSANHPPASDAIDILPTGGGGGDMGRRLLDLVVRHRGQVVGNLTAEANPKSASELRQLLVDAIRRAGRQESEIGDYEMAIAYSGEPQPFTTFVAAL
ncbi:MAG: tyrosine-type recombinase/integrase [Pseudonocardia sp.]